MSKLGWEWSEPCPKCGAGMNLRRNNKSGVYFLGCKNYPSCTNTEPVNQETLKPRRGELVAPGGDTKQVPLFEEMPNPPEYGANVPLEYRFVIASKASDFEEQVRVLLGEGFRPIGNHFVCRVGEQELQYTREMVR